jgi:hypothetical protein
MTPTLPKDQNGNVKAFDFTGISLEEILANYYEWKKAPRAGGIFYATINGIDVTPYMAAIEVAVHLLWSKGSDHRIGAVEDRDRRVLIPIHAWLTPVPHAEAVVHQFQSLEEMDAWAANNSPVNRQLMGTMTH